MLGFEKLSHFTGLRLSRRKAKANTHTQRVLSDRNSCRDTADPVLVAENHGPAIALDESSLGAASEEKPERLEDLGALWRHLLDLFGRDLTVHGFEDQAPAEQIRIACISDHSGRVRPGDVLFAVSGTERDGAQYVEEAIANGAIAIVADRALDSVLRQSLPLFVVPNTRLAVARIAAIYFGEPSRDMPVIGVTGTNGKTTVTDLLSLCLEDDSRQVGSLGTIQYRLGPACPSDPQDKDDADSVETIEKVVAATNTTPGPIALQSYLAEMRDRGVRASVIEVSSHALDQGRTDWVHFDTAVLTNLSQDHLDYHGDMESYGRAKARLFQKLKPGSLAVLPNDEPSAAYIFECLPQGLRLVTYGFGPATHKDAYHVRGRILKNDLSGISFLVETEEGSAEVVLPLVGVHNVRNALAALATAIGMGVGTLRAADALSRARPVLGRLERMDTGEGEFAIFVDYAHTPDALSQVLHALRPMTRGNLRVLFGCGGDRDRSKRPQMGRIAAVQADYLLVTDDNPRHENPDLIRRQILEGVESVEDLEARVEICGDRRKAIHHLLSLSEPGDTVLIAGKGHETGQVLGKEILPFSDREEVETWLSSN